MMQFVKTSPVSMGKFIRCFYSVFNVAAGEQIMHHRLPDGTLDLVFNLGDPVAISGNGLDFYNMPGVSLTGLYRDRRFLSYQGRVHLVGVVFQPGAANLFVQQALADWSASTADASGALGTDVYLWREQMAELSSESEKHRLLESHLMKILSKSFGRDRDMEKVLHAVQKIHDLKGHIQIENLQRECLMSPRSFRRMFSERVGMGAKQYAEIIRVKAFCANPHSLSEGYSEQLYDLGFTDHAHFNRAFRKITGTSPTAYLQGLQPLAVRFTQLI